MRIFSSPIRPILSKLFSINDRNEDIWQRPKTYRLSTLALSFLPSRMPFLSSLLRVVHQLLTCDHIIFQFWASFSSQLLELEVESVKPFGAGAKFRLALLPWLQYSVNLAIHSLTQFLVIVWIEIQQNNMKKWEARRFSELKEAINTIQLRP